MKNKKKGLVIADAGPIISLAVINKLDLLNDLFDEVLIPFAKLLQNKRYYNIALLNQILESNNEINL